MVMKKFRLFSIESLGLSCSAQSAGKFGLQLAERNGKHIFAPDDDIVIARLHVTRGMRAHGFSQPPPDAVADDCVADLLGDRVADARRLCVAAVQNLDEKKPPAALFATPDGQEFRALQKPLGMCSHWLAGGGQRSRLPFRR
jgi:hypothetical protein